MNGEKIRDGDWYIHFGITHNHPQEKYANLYQCHKGTRTLDNYDNYVKPEFSKNTLFVDGFYAKDCQKVIATNNPELWVKKAAEGYNNNSNTPMYNWNVPKIPLDFVERFVKEQGKIEKVDVEYEFHDIGDRFKGEFHILIPKLNKNGSVKVFPIEEKKYTREEFTHAVRQAWIYSNGIVKFEEWFNKNYPL